MKILQLCDRPHDLVKGFDLIEEAARGLSGAGHEFIFGILTGEADEKLQQRIGCTINLFHFPKRDLKRVNIAVVWRLIRYIRLHKIDVVITHRYKPWLQMAVASIFLSNVQFVSVFHAFKQFDRRRRQWLARLLLNKNWRMVGVSAAVRADLIAHNIPAELTAVIRNAIDIAGVRASQLPRDEARAYLGLPLQATVVGTLGRTKPIKGHKYLIEAYGRLMRRHADLWLIIIGGGEGEDDVRNCINALGPGARAIVTGQVNDAYRFLKALDLFVLPSLSEGFGLSLLEAMAANLPVIGSRVGGIPEAVGADGILVDRADAQQLADAIETALSWTPQQRQSYVEKLERHLIAEFDIESYRQRYRDLIAQLDHRRNG